MDTKLQLVFITENNKSYTINIDEPVSPVDPIDVKTAMDAIITNNIISTKNGSLVAIKGAYYVTRTVDEVILA